MRFFFFWWMNTMRYKLRNYKKVHEFNRESEQKEMGKTVKDFVAGRVFTLAKKQNGETRERVRMRRKERSDFCEVFWRRENGEKKVSLEGERKREKLCWACFCFKRWIIYLPRVIHLNKNRREMDAFFLNGRERGLKWPIVDQQANQIWACFGLLSNRTEYPTI